MKAISLSNMSTIYVISDSPRALAYGFQPISEPCSHSPSECLDLIHCLPSLRSASSVGWNTPRMFLCFYSWRPVPSVSTHQTDCQHNQLDPLFSIPDPVLESQTPDAPIPSSTSATPASCCLVPAHRLWLFCFHLFVVTVPFGCNTLFLEPSLTTKTSAVTLNSWSLLQPSILMLLLSSVLFVCFLQLHSLLSPALCRYFFNMTLLVILYCAHQDLPHVQCSLSICCVNE